ncbi:MAG TPA: hypothetical protein VGF38_09995 [Ktedonobacterales bacterium]
MSDKENVERYQVPLFAAFELDALMVVQRMRQGSLDLIGHPERVLSGEGAVTLELACTQDGEWIGNCVVPLSNVALIREAMKQEIDLHDVSLNASVAKRKEDEENEEDGEEDGEEDDEVG